MDTCIIKQPLLSKDQNVIAYEILNNDYQQKIDRDIITLEKILLKMDNDCFLDEKKIMVNFSFNLILKNFVKLFSPKRLVIQVNIEDLSRDLISDLIRDYKADGYETCVTLTKLEARSIALLDFVDYIKLDIQNENSNQYKDIIDIVKKFNKKVIISNVDDKNLYDYASKLDFDYIQGAYAAKGMAIKQSKYKKSQSSFFMLMTEVVKEEMEMEKIERIISSDTILTFSILKFVNSAFFSVRSEMETVKRALIVMGATNIKAWAYLLSFCENISDAHIEILKSNLLKAKVCFKLYNEIPKKDFTQNEAYLVGLFAELESLIDVPLIETLNQLNLSAKLIDALLDGKGVLGDLLNLVNNYEKAYWQNVADYAIDLRITSSVLSRVYIEAMQEVEIFWKELSTYSF
ncbi:MAG: HDOD domain-containing protein [Oscillospiraceae bacterium]